MSRYPVRVGGLPVPHERQWENDVWCPRCRELVGEVWSAQVNDTGVREYFTKPSPLPKRCDVCDAVIERKAV